VTWIASGKRILSINSGGFCGLSCLLTIEVITNEAQNILPIRTPALRLCQIFDVICGSSTGGPLAVLLGHLGLDCMTAIKEYKVLAQKLFCNDREAFLDIVMDKDAKLDPTQHEQVLVDLIPR
jgi:patatin-like phospholipase/acyl hydrolase